MGDRERKRKDLARPFFSRWWIMMDEFWRPEGTEIEPSWRREFDWRGRKRSRNNKPPLCVHSCDHANQLLAYWEWCPLLCWDSKKEKKKKTLTFMFDEEMGLGCQSSVASHTQDPTLPTLRQEEHFFQQSSYSKSTLLLPWPWPPPFFFFTPSCLVSSWHF